MGGGNTLVSVGSGGGGGSGYIGTSTMMGTVAGISATSVNTKIKYNNTNIIHFDEDATIEQNGGGSIRVADLFAMVKRSNEVLCKIDADMKRVEKYPALKEAYDYYTVVDALCRRDDDDPT